MSAHCSRSAPRDARQHARRCTPPATTSPTRPSTAIRGSSAELATATGQFTGAGFFGKGVDVDHGDARARRVPDARGGATASLSAMDGARGDQLDRLEQRVRHRRSRHRLRGEPVPQRMVDVASRPSDPSARQVVLARAEEVASRLRAAGTQLDALQSGVDEELTSAVAEVNGIAARLAQINAQVAALRAAGTQPNDLLDERDRLLHRPVVARAGDDDSGRRWFAERVRRRRPAARARRTGAAACRRARYLRSRSAPPSAVAKAAPCARCRRELFGGGKIAGLLRFQNGDLGARAQPHRPDRRRAQCRR